MTWEKIPRGEKDGSTVYRVNLAVESHSVSLEHKCAGGSWRPQDRALHIPDGSLENSLGASQNRNHACRRNSLAAVWRKDCSWESLEAGMPSQDPLRLFYAGDCGKRGDAGSGRA